jgi:predicted deacylase
MMETGHHSTSLANLFGLPFVVTRKPEPVDTATLNYNWQLSGTNAFSIYTSATDNIDEKSASQAVSSVLRFLTRMGIIKYNCHSGYIASVIEEHSLMPIRSSVSGIYRPLKHPGDEVKYGEIISEIIDPMEGEVISQVTAPSDGIIFFAHTKPLVIQNCVVYQLIRRMHE